VCNVLAINIEDVWGRSYLVVPAW